LGLFLAILVLKLKSEENFYFAESGCYKDAVASFKQNLVSAHIDETKGTSETSKHS